MDMHTNKNLFFSLSRSLHYSNDGSLQLSLEMVLFKYRSRKSLTRHLKINKIKRPRNWDRSVFGHPSSGIHWSCLQRHRNHWNREKGTKKMKQKREKVSQCRGINQEVLNSSPKQMIYIFERLLSTRKKRDEQQENMAKKKKSIWKLDNLLKMKEENVCKYLCFKK